MPLAAHKRPAAIHALLASRALDAVRRFSGPSRAVASPRMLSPGGTLAGLVDEVSEETNQRSRLLAIAIRQRIESRLPGRIHDLEISVADNRVHLEGRCATYYSKQLAQHAALGVLEEELLENAIVVAVPR